MLKRVLDFIKQQHMLEAGDRVLAAVSGGADSVCLLVLLCRLKETLGLASISAVHLHHGLRGQAADQDAAYVVQLCNRLQVSCFVEYRDVQEYSKVRHCSVEEAGRMLRYQVFDQISAAQGINKIAVAHHQDDMAETILHHLVRGSGLKGLAGIPAVRGGIVRPLLCVGRNEIETYLTAEQFSWCDDLTNTTDAYTRNKIRHSLMPLLTGLNAQAVGNICQAGQFIRQADDFLEAQARLLLEQHGICYRTEGVCCCEVPVELLSGQAKIMTAYLIRQMLRQCRVPLADITAQHICLIEELLDKPTGAHVDLPGQTAAERIYDKLGIFNHRDGKKSGEPLPLLHFRKFSSYNAGEIPKNQYTKWLDYDKIIGMLSVRTRESGDYLTISGNHKKRFKQFLIDEKIPRHRRSGIVLLAEENHIIWIIGYRISEYYKITAATKTILEVTMDESCGYTGGDYGR